MGTAGDSARLLDGLGDAVRAVLAHKNSLTDEEWLVALAHVEAIRGSRAAAGIELEDDTPQWLVEAAMKMTLVERTEEESRPAHSGLPAGWCCGWSPVHRQHYYYSVALNVTQWAPPLPPTPDTLAVSHDAIEATDDGGAAEAAVSACSPARFAAPATNAKAWEEHAKLAVWAEGAAALSRRHAEERGAAFARARSIWRQLDLAQRAELQRKWLGISSRPLTKGKRGNGE
ncbi:hypothetical protein EMIHUDRAFT_217334 [Emiliania huxleyi CCMP1516]|uniref:WW domain-containing protein n=2 Tax=Emiliania huxleyi TaxID=2903 RepID=A0A0D3IBG8_EMIH1|nr:hypothetical protein EMIHUDRAFT_217334 [Emiliania huxleyi CCMP1516]EOD08603.1 hypothetical protein EMIHUDRAFT_217334 [Emiliania huxleyi CCMP1516]|eukprot:XP_005761032.1 hypothetical protein EMIHUDRAFT_217334 [Emiliania huxleyi CCMP1516]